MHSHHPVQYTVDLQLIKGEALNTPNTVLATATRVGAIADLFV